MYISLFEKLTINSLLFILHNSEARGLTVDSMHTFDASDASDFEAKELVFDFCAPVWFPGHGCTLPFAGKAALISGWLWAFTPLRWGDCRQPGPGAVPGAVSVPPQCVISTVGLPGVNSFWKHQCWPCLRTAIPIWIDQDKPQATCKSPKWL